MSVRRLFTTVLLLVVLILPAGSLRAQDPPPDTPNEPNVPDAAGDLDTSFGGFGNGGKIANAPLDIHAMALQRDGKIVVAGQKDGTFALARYFPNGARDASFGTGGVVKTTIHSTQSEAGANAVAIQANGRIVAAGYAALANGKDFALARYFADGTLDDSFSGNGKVTSNFDFGDDVAYALAIQNDGKIVVAGQAYIVNDFAADTYDFGVERFLANGALDTSFSDNGKQDIGFDEDDGAFALAIQADGKIVVAGGANDCDTPPPGLCNPVPIGYFDDFALARLNTDGTLDGSFDGDGKVKTGLGGTDTAFAVALHADGKIIAVGGRSDGGFALARYLPTGALDTTFDGDGKLTTSLTDGKAQSVAVQPDGKIVAAGTGMGQFALLRYNANGTRDTSFDGDGALFTNFQPGIIEQSFALALQPDGRLIAAGEQYLARYFPDGSLDAGGRQLIAFGAPVTAEEALALAVQPDGKIVTAGYKAESTDQFALARLDPDGALDPTFDGDGLLTFGFGGEERAQAVAIGSDGSIVAAGFVTSPGAGDNFMIARFESNGLVDCFNITDFQNGDDWPYAVAIQPDQKIIVAGRVWDVSSGNYEMGIARYNANCAIDSSFGAGGKTQVGFGAGAEMARAVVVQPDNKIVLAGAANNNLVLVRLTENGSLDVSFGSGGRVVKDLGGSEAGYALARLANGQLIVAGTTGSDFLLARYNSNGSLDTAFGANGVSTLDFGVVDTAYAIAIDANGAIAAAGCGLSALGLPIQFEVAQLRPDGAPDTTFSGDGKVVTTFGDAVKCARGVGFTSNNGIVAGGYAEANNDVNFALAQYLTPASESGLRRVYLPAVMK